MSKNRVVVLDVDLTCHRCNKKIKNILARYKDKWGIETITFDEENGKVTVSGPFDPKELVRKLCREACDVIREWCIQKPVTHEQPKSGKPPKTPKPPPPPEPPITVEKPITPTTEPKRPTCYPCPYPYPYPYPYPLPIHLPAWCGNKGCSCGGHCGGHGPCRCGCGCGHGCSRPHHPLPLTYGGPFYVACEEEANGCGMM